MLHRLRLSQRIALFPALMLLVGGVTLTANFMMGRRANEIAAHIHLMYYPAFEISEDLEEILADIHGEHQKIATPGDHERLGAADSIRADFLKRLDEARTNPYMAGEQLDALVAA